MAKIKVRYIRKIPKLLKIHKGDWIDLYTPFDVVLYKNKYECIPLGIAIELPKGYEALVVPRSSLFKNYGVIMVNSVGIIDESYKGDNDEWQFPCVTLNEVACIPKFTRICQFRILKHQPKLRIQVAEHLSINNRGGFGSTGKGVINEETK